MTSISGTDNGNGYGVKGTSDKKVGVYGKSNEGIAVYGKTKKDKAIAVKGLNASQGIAVYGESNGGIGVFGTSQEGVGSYGESKLDNGVQGVANNTGKAGVFGYHKTGLGAGVVGLSESAPDFRGDGVLGYSKYGNGTLGISEYETGVYAESTEGMGIQVYSKNNVGIMVKSTANDDQRAGLNVESTAGPGIQASSESNDGIVGNSNVPRKSGVVGINPADGGNGVAGLSESGSGVYGHSNNGFGVYAESQNNDGISGSTVLTGKSGVVGYNKSSGGHGVSGISEQGTALYGETFSGTGLDVSTYFGTSIKAQSVYDLGMDVYGKNAIKALSIEGTGIRSVVLAGTSEDPAIGVLGSTIQGEGIRGTVFSGIAVHGIAPFKDANSYAGKFDGNVSINGVLWKNASFFLIDHPLDPSNKYLEHCSIESDELKNMYDGTVILDDEGLAIVRLPSWFEALNHDYRYQLTPIKAPAPGLYIKEEISDGEFIIAGGKPGMKVCWQVTAIRQDAWAKENPMEVERNKPENERGYYLHPELFGATKREGINWLYSGDISSQLEEQVKNVQEAKNKVETRKNKNS